MWNRRSFFLGLLISLMFFLAFLSGEALSNSQGSGKVTFISGTVTAKRGGAIVTLQQGSEVLSGDLVETAKKSKVEIVLLDKSVIRLGPKSKIEIQKSNFASENQRDFSAKMLKGKVYAVASKQEGSNSSFEIETSNAVAGVRGTTFRIDSKQDKSTVVRVYTGAVAVSNAPIYQKPGKLQTPPKQSTPKKGVKPGGPDRQEIAGPHEVTKKEWEEFVAQAMQEVKVAANGQMSQPVAFNAEADLADEWVAWNKSRDKQMQP